MVGCLKASSPAPSSRLREECTTPGVHLRGLSVTIAATREQQQISPVFPAITPTNQQQQNSEANVEGKPECAIDIAYGGRNQQNEDSTNNGQPMWWLTTTTSAILLVQAALITLFTAFVRYAPLADGSHPGNNHHHILGGYVPEDNPVHKYFHNVMTVHLLMLAGLGLRLAFLRDVSHGSVGVSLLIGGISIQWAIVCHGYFSAVDGDINLDIYIMFQAQVSSIAVSISHGAVLGLTSPLQMLILTLLFIPLHIGNVFLANSTLKTTDLGGSVTLHLFSAVFGVFVSRALGVSDTHYGHTKPLSTRTSQIAAYLGSVYMVAFLPSVWSSYLVGDDHHRAVINTILATFSALVISFPASSICHSRRKFSLSDIQCGLVGGFVAVGGVANLMLQPYGALLLGASGSLITIIARHFLRPKIRSMFGVHDICCVGVSHGLGGLVGGLAGVVMASFASENGLYGYSVYEIYPAMSPPEGSAHLIEVSSYLVVDAGDGRSASLQAAYQLLSLVSTVVTATIGGTLTGFLLRLPFLEKPGREDLYSDGKHWQEPTRLKRVSHARHRISRTHHVTHANAHHTPTRVSTPYSYRRLEANANR